MSNPEQNSHKEEEEEEEEKTFEEIGLDARLIRALTKKDISVPTPIQRVAIPLIQGCILLTFWPAVGERKYNWEKRQLFALSPTELGSLISLESGKSCEFFHDPFMKSSNAGQIKKSLTVSPMGKDDGGYFFSLNVVNGVQDTNERFSVPITKAEFTVMRTAFSYILPHIMGWDQVIRQEQPSNGTNQGRQQASPKYEWDR